jgi:hypothetical protein
MGRKLKYVGGRLKDGDPRKGSFFPGVPLGDHTCEDNGKAAALVESGLYAYAPSAKSKEKRVKSKGSGPKKAASADEGPPADVAGDSEGGER